MRHDTYVRFPLSSFDLGLLGCDHVSNAHGGCIVYPIFAILLEACWRSHAASYSYSSLSSFSAKSLFEIHPVVSATIELPPVLPQCFGNRPSLPVLYLRSCPASFLINSWSQLVATGHNWLSACYGASPGTLGRSSATLGELGGRVGELARDTGGLGRGC